MKTCVTLFVMIALIALQSSQAQIPRTLSYQGVLTNTAGSAKPDGDYAVTFRLYSAAGGGAALWTELQTLHVKRGLFSAILGSVTPLGAELTFAQPYWLTLQVAPDAEMTPRLPLSSVAYSLNSVLADGQVVRGINNLHDAVTLQAQGGATITSNGNVLTINAGSGGGGTGIQGVQNTDNTLTIVNPNGPTATVNVKDPLVLNGSVGIGTTPVAGIRLDVNGSSRYTPGGSGGAISLGAPNGETGMLILGASSRADLRFDGSAVKLVAGTGTGPPSAANGILITTGGSVGIGRAPLNGFKMDVSGATRMTPGGNGGEILFHTPNGESGMTIIGTNRADLRFDGNSIKLFATTGTLPPANGISINTAGTLSANNGATVTGTNGDGAVITARRSAGDSYIIIDATPPSQNSVMAYRKNDLNRWLMFADNTSESGGNAGSDFRLDAYNDAGNGIATRLIVNRATGNVGIGTINPTARLEVIGRTKTGSLEVTAGSDLAEPFETGTDQAMEPGSIMVIDDMHPGKLKISETPYDARVAGIVSGAGNIKPGITLHQDGVTNGSTIVAIAGRVYCKADAHSAPIAPGDLLTTSGTPGHAMKATERERSYGAIIGKAMSSLKEGTGLVLVLVNLQ
jgi:hypothetical protein